MSSPKLPLGPSRRHNLLLTKKTSKVPTGAPSGGCTTLGGPSCLSVWEGAPSILPDPAHILRLRAWASPPPDPTPGGLEAAQGRCQEPLQGKPLHLPGRDLGPI